MAPSRFLRRGSFSLLPSYDSELRLERLRAFFRNGQSATKRLHRLSIHRDTLKEWCQRLVNRGPLGPPSIRRDTRDRLLWSFPAARLDRPSDAIPPLDLIASDYVSSTL